MQTAKRLKPVVAALLSKCNDEGALLDCLELLMGRVTSARNGVKGGRSKLRITDSISRKVVDLKGSGMTNARVAEEAEIGLSTVSRILRDASNGDTFGKRKKAKGKKTNAKKRKRS